MTKQFVSFPKSGRSWIRFMLVHLGVEDDILFHHDGFEFNDGAKPPHNFDLSQRLQYYANVEKLIYLERDPRDVMLSLYHQVTGRFRDFFNYDGQISDFIRDDYFGAENLLRFHSLWTEIVSKHNFLSVTYEDCSLKPLKTLEVIVDYYGYRFDQSALVQATHEASFENMKSVEQTGSFPAPWLRPRNGHFKVREGRVGGFRGAFSVADQRYLSDVFSLPAIRGSNTTLSH